MNNNSIASSSPASPSRIPQDAGSLDLQNTGDGGGKTGPRPEGTHLLLLVPSANLSAQGQGTDGQSTVFSAQASSAPLPARQTTGASTGQAHPQAGRTPARAGASSHAGHANTAVTPGEAMCDLLLHRPGLSRDEAGKSLLQSQKIRRDHIGNAFRYACRQLLFGLDDVQRQWVLRTVVSCLKGGRSADQSYPEAFNVLDRAGQKINPQTWVTLFAAIGRYHDEKRAYPLENVSFDALKAYVPQEEQVFAEVPMTQPPSHVQRRPAASGTESAGTSGSAGSVASAQARQEDAGARRSLDAQDGGPQKKLRP